MSAELEIEDVSLSYGGLIAIDGLDLRVERGRVHGLIGPNGAGKTSVFNAISGLAPRQSGAIKLRGARIDRLSPDARAARGLARTFQNLRLFTEMTALENVLVGMHARIKASPFEVMTRLGRFRSAERDALRDAHELLAFVGLAAVAERRAGALSYGDRRRLEIARALAAKPSVLLLDEPAAGMNPAETAALESMLGQIKARDVTMLLVEHDMSLVMRLCDRITVLNFGVKIAEGAPAAVRADKAVIEAYLGGAGESQGQAV